MKAVINQSMSLSLNLLWLLNGHKLPNISGENNSTIGRPKIT